MADDQFRFILQAAEMIEAEDQRSEGNASEYDTDLEEEEVHVGDVQSDGGLTERTQREQQQARASGRKRVHSETASGARRLSPAPPDAKCSKQASNLHNEREKERRKDLKLAVHRLRNQLQLRKTKKATTISVLKASEQEIKDLLDIEEAQKRKLSELQNQHNHLKWKLKSLLAEQEKEGARPMASSSKPAQKILPSQQSAVPPPAPLTSVAPVFYMPSTPSATHSPSVPGSPHPVVMPAHQTIPTISPSNFHFAAPGLSPFSGYPILSPTPPFSIQPPHAFPLQPTRQLFLVPSQTPLLPQFLPNLPSGQIPHRFSFPPAPASLSPHTPSPSPFFLHSLSPPGHVPAASHFPIYLTRPSAAAAVDDSTLASFDDPATQISPVESDSDRYSPELQGRDTPSPPTPPDNSNNNATAGGQMTQQTSLKSDPKQPSSGDPQGICDSGNQRRASSDSASEPVIDVESTEQEDSSPPDRQPFLDVRFLHHKQRKRHCDERKMTVSFASSLCEKEEVVNGKRLVLKSRIQPPALVNQAGKSTNVSRIMKRVEPATKVITQEIFASTFEKHHLLFEDLPTKNNKAKRREEGQFCPWKQLQPSSTSVVDLTSHSHMTTVICS